MYPKIEMWLSMAIVASAACVSAADYDVAAYVWPAYQPEPRWAELDLFKDGKGEWQNVYEAKPKWEVGVRTIRRCMHSHNEVCPWR